MSIVAQLADRSSSIAARNWAYNARLESCPRSLSQPSTIFEFIEMNNRISGMDDKFSNCQIRCVAS